MKSNKKVKRKKKFNAKDNTLLRVKIIKLLLFIFFALIIIRIIYLNIYLGSYYKMRINNEKDTVFYGESVPRGRILDRNGKVLVDNKAVKSIIYRKPFDVTTEDEIKTAYKMSDIIKLDYNKLKERNKKEFYILINSDETDRLITEEEYQKLENRKLTEDDIYELKIKRISKEKINKMSKEDRKAAYIYYLMNKGYYYEDKVIKEDSVTNKEYVYFKENIGKLNGFKSKLEWERTYPYKNTLRSIFGNVSTKESGIPKESINEFLKDGYTLSDRVGISGLEKQYEYLLKGEKATYKIVNGKTVLIKEGKKGKDIKLSIDIDLQTKIDKMIERELINAKYEANTEYFNKIYLVIENPNTGEIYSISGKELSKKGKVYDVPEGVFLSTITPGSVVKGASIMVGYTNNAIDIGDYMLDSCIKLYNLPEKCSWKTLGYVNDLDALALSSNVYQYKIAMKVGGFNYVYGKKLKINDKAFDIYRNMFYRYGLGVKTGIDYPKEEDGYKSSNRSGDLLINYAIGQYDTYTTLQLSQYVSTIANGGTRYKTKFLKSIKADDKFLETERVALNKLDVKKKYINRVRKGLRRVMTTGTGVGYISEDVIPSGKTGTSESLVDLNDDGVMDTDSISSNFVGYAPSNKPVMSIAAAFPDIQNPKTKYKSMVNQRVVKNATDIFFDLYNTKGERINKK